MVRVYLWLRSPLRHHKPRAEAWLPQCHALTVCGSSRPSCPEVEVTGPPRGARIARCDNPPARPGASEPASNTIAVAPHVAPKRCRAPVSANVKGAIANDRSNHRHRLAPAPMLHHRGSRPEAPGRSRDGDQEVGDHRRAAACADGGECAEVVVPRARAPPAVSGMIASVARCLG